MSRVFSSYAGCSTDGGEASLLGKVFLAPPQTNSSPRKQSIIVDCPEFSPLNKTESHLNGLGNNP